MSIENEELYYRFLIPLREIVVERVPLRPAWLLNQALPGPWSDGRVVYLEVITGVDRSSQPQSYVRIAYLDAHDRLAVRLVRDPGLLETLRPQTPFQAKA